MFSVTYEDDLLGENYSFLNSISQFYTATSRTDLALFKTDIVYSGGMDAWESAETSQYPLFIAAGSLLKALLASLILIYA